MKRTLVLTAVALTGVGLVLLLPQWRLKAEESRPPRQQGARAEAFRGRERPGIGDPSMMRDQVLRRFDEILDRLSRIERRLEGGPPSRHGDAGRRPSGHSEHGHGPRPPRPEWMGKDGEGFRPGPQMRPPRGDGRQMGSKGRPLGRLELPKEMREQMEQRMRQGRERMEQARERMEQARKQFAEMQKRVETLEAEVKRLKKAGNES